MLRKNHFGMVSCGINEDYMRIKRLSEELQVSQDQAIQMAVKVLEEILAKEKASKEKFVKE